MKKFGFTLAEVLITLAIIGVIAAITLPSLMDNANERALEKQTAKFYSTLQNAIGMIKSESQVDDLSDINLTPELIVSKLKVRETCKVSDCAPAKYAFLDGSDKQTAAKLFSGSDQESKTSDSDMYVLDDGLTLFISQKRNSNDRDENDNSKIYVSTQPITLYFDVNGKKGPNIFGRDLWAVSISDAGKVGDTELTIDTQIYSSDKNSFESESKITKNLFKDKCAKLDGACFGHFLKNGFKFDY